MASSSADENGPDLRSIFQPISPSLETTKMSHSTTESSPRALEEEETREEDEEAPLQAKRKKRKPNKKEEARSKMESSRKQWAEKRKQWLENRTKSKEQENVKSIIAEECATLIDGFSYFEPPPTIPVPVPMSPCTCMYCFQPDGSRRDVPDREEADYRGHIVCSEYSSVTEIYHVWYGLGHYTDLPLSGGINALEKEPSKWRDVTKETKERSTLTSLRKIVRAVVNRQNVSNESLETILQEFDQLWRKTRDRQLSQLIRKLKANAFIEEETQQSSLTTDSPVGHQEYCSLLDARREDNYAVPVERIRKKQTKRDREIEERIARKRKKLADNYAVQMERIRKKEAKKDRGEEGNSKKKKKLATIEGRKKRKPVERKIKKQTKRDRGEEGNSKKKEKPSTIEGRKKRKEEIQL
jgi:hypothetical protein